MAETGDERAYYSISEVAARLGVSRVTVWRWIRDRRLPVARLGHRTTRITRDDLERALTQIGPGGTHSWIGRRREAEGEADDTTGSIAAPTVDQHEIGPSEHIVQFYETDGYLLDAVAEFIGGALRVGDAGLVIASEGHRDGLAERFRGEGLDLDEARASGRYVSLDAEGTLARFMVDSLPDPARFAEVIGGIVTRATAGGRRVRLFGEMVALLAADGNRPAALRLEELWNDLQRTHSFALFCAYPLDRHGGEALAGVLDDVCARHSRVVPAESYSALASADDRRRAIAVLQQKARRLEAEIAEREQMEERLRTALAAEQEARQAAESALRMRDEFVSIAAHELRTPLTTLSGQVQLTLRLLARDGSLDPERLAQSLHTITGQAGKLGRLLGQLLDVTRLEAGKLGVERGPCDLAALVEQAVAARARSDRHPISLSAPRSVVAEIDAFRLEQVLTNLLDNAVKYSPDGGAIEVSVRRMRDAAVELAVRDHGLGIPPEKRAQIFERFYQAHAAGHRSGLGLGLYICRQIVELHGGEIRAEFPADGGTRFVVRLPLAGADSATMLESTDSDAAAPLALSAG